MTMNKLYDTTVNQWLEVLEIDFVNKRVLFDSGELSHSSVHFNQVIGLHPPTEEEVCKALSDYFGFDIVYSDGEFIPKIPEDYYFYIVTVVDGGIVFTDTLPPHLIILVGKFYEGLDNE